MIMQSKKHLFSLADDVTYLNMAYMSPSTKAVEQAGLEAVSRKNRPNEIGIPDFFDPVWEVRKSFGKLINNNDHCRICITPSVSYGIANAARNIQIKTGKDIIVVLEEQFPSNYYVWKELAEEKSLKITTVKAPTDKSKWNQHILDHIDEKTLVVTMPNVHWADGTLFDLYAIREKTKHFEVPLIIDATQTVGAYPTDIQQLQPDALVTCSYKWLLGAFGMGLAYYGEYFDQGKPIEESWYNRKNAEDFSNLANYQMDYGKAALRYNVGQMGGFIHIAMMNQALNHLLEWDAQMIQDYCAFIAKDAIQELESLGCRIPPIGQRAHHLWGFRLPDHVNAHTLNERLKASKIMVSIRGDAVRVAPYLFNEKADFEKLVEVVKEEIG